MLDNYSDIMTIDEVVEALSLSRPTVDRLINEKKLKRIKYGKCIRIAKEDLINTINELKEH